MSTQGPGAVNVESVAQTQRAIAQLKKASRNSNFSFSTTPKPQFFGETSAAHAFASDRLKEKKSTHIGQVQNMRVANFQMGFAPGAYSTTTDHNNRFASTTQSFSADRQQAQKDRVQKNRMPHYDFGRDAVNYKSIAKNEYTTHDLSQAKQSQLDRATNAKDVRQTHFLLGTDGRPSSLNVHPNTTKAGPNERNISTALFRQPSNAAAGTNIQIYHQGVAGGCNRFTSSYQSSNSLQINPVKLTQKASYLQKRNSQGSGMLEPAKTEDMTASMNRTVAACSTTDFKQANFVLGGYTGTMKSQNQSVLGRHEIPENQNQSRQELKKRMQTT